MRKITLLLLFPYVISCSHKDYKYEIKGKVRTKIQTGDYFTGKKNKTVVADAIAYTDTIYGITQDSVWFLNSDSSLVSIHCPFTVKELK